MSFHSRALSLLLLLMWAAMPLRAQLHRHHVLTNQQDNVQLDQPLAAVAAQDGRTLYALARHGEPRTPVINVLKFSDAFSKPRIVQTLTANSPDGTPLTAAAKLVLSPDGRHLYALDRTESRRHGVSVFNVAPEDARLTLNHYDANLAVTHLQFGDATHAAALFYGNTAAVVRRDANSGRLSLAEVYRPGFELAADFPNGDDLYFNADTRRITLYHRVAGAFSVLQLDETFKLTSVGTAALAKEYFEDNNPLEIVQFRDHGRHILLGSAIVPTLYELYLDPAGVRFLDFRRTDTSFGANQPFNLRDILVDETHQKIYMMYNYELLQLETAFPFGPTRLVKRDNYSGPLANNTAFVGEQLMVSLLEPSFTLQMWQRGPSGLEAGLLLDTMSPLGTQLLSYPLAMVQTTDRRDLYVANGSDGLNHFHKDAYSQPWRFVANYLADHDGDSYDFEQFANNVIRSKNGRSLLTLNETVLQAFERAPADGALTHTATIPSPFPGTERVVGLSAFTFSADQNQVLVFDQNAWFAVYDVRAPGKLDLAQQPAPLNGPNSPHVSPSSENSLYVSADNTLWVLLNDGVLVKMARDAGGIWRVSGQFDEHLTAWDMGFVTGIYGDPHGDDIWVRGEKGMARYAYRPETGALHLHSLMHHDGDLDAYGPIAFGRNRVYIGNREKNEILLQDRDGDGWGEARLWQASDDARPHFQGAQFMTFDPSENHLLIGSLYGYALLQYWDSGEIIVNNTDPYGKTQQD